MMQQIIQDVTSKLPETTSTWSIADLEEATRSTAIGMLSLLVKMWEV